MEFSPGDIVIHPQHGTATVVDVESRTVAGTTRQYVVLRHADDDLVLRVPLESLEDLGVRAAAGEKQAERILATLEEPPQDLSTNWQKRRPFNDERIRSGDATQAAAVVRDLLAWGEQRDDMPSADRRTLEEARTRLVNELAEALDREPEEVEALIDERLSRS